MTFYGTVFILEGMNENMQITYMQARLVRLAAEQEHIPIPEMAKVFDRFGVFRYIRDMWELFHIEGDFAVLEDIKQYLAARGVPNVQSA